MQEEYLFKQYFEGALLGFEDDSSRNGSTSLAPYIHPGLTQKQFYQYLAEKEESNLIRVIDRLKGLNQYEILIETKSPGAVYSLKKQIASWFHRDTEHRPFKQTLSPKKDRIELVGEIPYFTLNKILSSIQKKGSITYKIHVNGKR